MIISIKTFPIAFDKSLKISALNINENRIRSDQGLWRYGLYDRARWGTFVEDA